MADQIRHTPGRKGAAKGWRDLENVAPGNLRKAWEIMRYSPDLSIDESRHARLKDDLRWVTRKGVDLPHWQIEVTSGGRIWYAWTPTLTRSGSPMPARATPRRPIADQQRTQPLGSASTTTWKRRA